MLTYAAFSILDLPEIQEFGREWVVWHEQLRIVARGVYRFLNSSSSVYDLEFFIVCNFLCAHIASELEVRNQVTAVLKG